MKLIIKSILIFFALVISNPVYNQDKITFIESAVDTSAGDLECYKIVTAKATYYLEKKGFGLSSLLDSEGNDWISHHPKPGSKAGGEHRGFPNAVHNQDASFFHPYNVSTQPTTSKVLKKSSDCVSIEGISSNNNWHCRWDFYPTHCSFTMTKMPDGYKYWILYEGTPGGEFDDSDYYMISSEKEKVPVTTNYDKDIPGPEWIVFGDPNVKRVLFMANHKDDDYPDKYWQLNHQMTVFGFGRDGLTKFYEDVPRTFSIGFIESTHHKKIEKTIHKIMKFQDK